MAHVVKEKVGNQMFTLFSPTWSNTDDNVFFRIDGKEHVKIQGGVNIDKGDTIATPGYWFQFSTLSCGGSVQYGTPLMITPPVNLVRSLKSWTSGAYKGVDMKGPGAATTSCKSKVADHMFTIEGAGKKKGDDIHFYDLVMIRETISRKNYVTAAGAGMVWLQDNSQNSVFEIRKTDGKPNPDGPSSAGAYWGSFSSKCEGTKKVYSSKAYDVDSESAAKALSSSYGHPPIPEEIAGKKPSRVVWNLGWWGEWDVLDDPSCKAQKNDKPFLGDIDREQCFEKGGKSYRRYKAHCINTEGWDWEKECYLDASTSTKNNYPHEVKGIPDDVESSTLGAWAVWNVPDDLCAVDETNDSSVGRNTPYEVECDAGTNTCDTSKDLGPRSAAAKKPIKTGDKVTFRFPHWVPKSYDTFTYMFYGGTGGGYGDGTPPLTSKDEFHFSFDKCSGLSCHIKYGDLVQIRHNNRTMRCRGDRCEFDGNDQNCAVEKWETFRIVPLRLSYKKDRLKRNEDGTIYLKDGESGVFSKFDQMARGESPFEVESVETIGDDWLNAAKAGDDVCYGDHFMLKVAHMSPEEDKPGLTSLNGTYLTLALGRLVDVELKGSDDDDVEGVMNGVVQVLPPSGTLYEIGSDAFKKEMETAKKGKRDDDICLMDPLSCFDGVKEFLDDAGDLLSCPPFLQLTGFCDLDIGAKIGILVAIFVGGIIVLILVVQIMKRFVGGPSSTVVQSTPPTPASS